MIQTKSVWIVVIYECTLFSCCCLPIVLQLKKEMSQSHEMRLKTKSCNEAFESLQKFLKAEIKKGFLNIIQTFLHPISTPGNYKGCDSAGSCVSLRMSYPEPPLLRSPIILSANMLWLNPLPTFAERTSQTIFLSLKSLMLLLSIIRGESPYALKGYERL